MKRLMKCHPTLLPLSLPIGYQPLSRSLTSSTSTYQRKWKPKTTLIITNPTLLLMESCSTMRQMKQIQAQMTLTGLITDTFPASRVLAFCALADSGDIPYAHAFFTQIEKPNTYMWNTMIRGYLKAQFPEMGFSFFGQMVREGIEMDGLSFVWVLKACGNFPGISEGNLVHSHDCLDEAKQVFESMLLSNVKPNEVTMIAMLSVCSSKGDILMGKQIYDYITIQNVNCSLNLLNATLDMFVKFGYSQNNQPKEALILFQDMMKAGLFPIENTLVCVLSACGQLGCLDLGQWIHRCCINPKGVQQSVILSNALIDMYAKSGSIYTAASLFNEMPLRNLVSWNTMIAGYASHGYAKQALILFEQMKNAGFEPDSITFVAVLSACSHGGLVSEGREHFKSMSRDYELEPREEHYACLIDLLGRIGLLDQAYHLIRNMPMLPSESAWGALLNACRMHGNVELAKLSAQKLLEMDPQDSGIYVLLANTLANNKKWVDVRMVRSMMREVGVKKSPGRSLIEIEGEFHEFLAGDDSHPQSKEIYKVFDELS
ncbi:hypothetical protein CsatA_027713 [Cannabis sativa]